MGFSKLQVGLGSFLIGIFMYHVHHIYESPKSNSEEPVVQFIPLANKGSSRRRAKAVDKNQNSIPCSIKPSITSLEFFQYFEKENYPCKNLRRFGGMWKGKEEKKFFDGDKVMCLDQQFHITPDNCVVLSFGISKDFSFDDAIAEYGCKVYAFDPFTSGSDHQRSQNIWFYKMGIAASASQGHVKMMTLEDVIKMLNLTNKYIDYLKMDIEGSEVNVITQIVQLTPHLLPYIKQIAMEIHPKKYYGSPITTLSSGSRLYSYWTLFSMLECAGFRLLNVDLNPALKTKYRWNKTNQSCCYEVSYVQDKIFISS